MGIEHHKLPRTAVEDAEWLKNAFARLRRTCRRSGKEIATRAECSEASVSQTLSGKKIPRSGMAKAIAKAMDASAIDVDSIGRRAENYHDAKNRAAALGRGGNNNRPGHGAKEPATGGLRSDQLDRLADALGPTRSSEVVEALWHLGSTGVRLSPAYTDSLDDLGTLLRHLNERTDAPGRLPLPVEFGEVLAVGRSSTRSVYPVVDQILSEMRLSHHNTKERRNLQAKQYRKPFTVVISLAVDPYERAGRGFDLRVWIRREGVSMPLWLDSSCRRPAELRQAGEKLLADALTLTPPMDDAKDLTYEFILPYALSGLDVGGWVIGDGTAAPLGVQARVITRSLDRMRSGDPWLDRQWRHRWKALTQGSAQDSGAANRTVALPPLSEHDSTPHEGLEALRRRLTLDPGIACFVAGDTGQDVSEGWRQQMRVAIDMGVPAGVWCAGSRLTTQLMSVLRTSNGKGHSVLPDWAFQQRRNAYHAGTSEPGPGIMWDNPYTVPESNWSLTSPIEPV